MRCLCSLLLVKVEFEVIVGIGVGIYLFCWFYLYYRLDILLLGGGVYLKCLRGDMFCVNNLELDVFNFVCFFMIVWFVVIIRECSQDIIFYNR